MMATTTTKRSGSFLAMSILVAWAAVSGWAPARASGAIKPVPPAGGAQPAKPTGKAPAPAAVTVTPVEPLFKLGGMRGMPTYLRAAPESIGGLDGIAGGEVRSA